MTTLTTVSSSPNATLSSSSPGTEQTSSDILPAAINPHDNGTDNGAVFNYYFLFLVMFGVLVAVLLWWLQRQKKRRKELTRLGAQDALARDMEGWTNTRRFMHGRYARNHQAAFIRREEGLDEHGEAPPPYQPKNEATEAQEPVEAAQTAASRVTIPLRTVAKDVIDRSRPPAY
ncbi:Nn.00g043460.m01.CDS01 [Neocucurbitaria sp. VM-36]